MILADDVLQHLVVGVSQLSKQKDHKMSFKSEFQNANTNTNLIACVMLCGRVWLAGACARFFSE